MKYNNSPETIIKKFKMRVNCPACGRETPHYFRRLTYSDSYFQKASQVSKSIFDNSKASDVLFGHCDVCREIKYHMITEETESVVTTQHIYPPLSVADVPQCNKDMPINCQKIYDEAANVFPFSPRSAGALLRLCVQSILKERGRSERKLVDAIRNYEKDNPHPRLKYALDCCRLVGNQSVHPGEIDIDSNMEDVVELFDAVNLIATEIYTRPKRIERIVEKYSGKKQPFPDSEKVKKE